MKRALIRAGLIASAAILFANCLTAIFSANPTISSEAHSYAMVSLMNLGIWVIADRMYEEIR